MLKVYRNVLVVVCTAALTGMFVGTASADFIYDFDANVGQALNANQSLTGQDNWEVRTGNSAWEDNIGVGTGASGWTGNYALNTSSDSAQSYEIRNSSFSLQDGLDFEISAVISNDGTGTTMQTGLEHDYGWGHDNWMVFGSSLGKFGWFVRENDATNDFTQLITLQPSMPDTSAKIWRVGFEVTAMGGNEYGFLPYYQDVTDPNNIGAKVYQYDTGNVPYDVTFSSPLSGMFNQLYMRMASNVSGGNIMDDFRITQVPEPSTMALLAAGLIGLLAYAWRKRK